MAEQLDTSPWQGIAVYTVGHSTRPVEELTSLLEAFGVKTLADVRTIPRSRHNPQFAAEALAPALRARSLQYVHIAELGGLRRPRPDSPNAAWRNKSFQGYADYMQTDAFETGLDKLRALAQRGTVAVMCAEAVHWRCHRSLIADVLTARGASVAHIASAQRAAPHRLTPFARVDGMHVTYPVVASGPLSAAAPFDLQATVRVLQRRPSNRIDVWANDSYRRVLRTSEGLALVEVSSHGSRDAPDVRFEVLCGPKTQTAAQELTRLLRQMLGLDVDPAPLLQLMAATPHLAALVSALRGMRPPRYPGLFETFANVLPFQQVSLDAGVAIVTRLVARFGETLEHAGQEHAVFPEAARIADARLPALRACGLTARKAEALRHAARAIERDELSEQALCAMPSPEAMRRLTQLPGIGPWSAALILLRGLGRLDVFPPSDVGIARALAHTTGLSSEAKLKRVLNTLGEHRGYLYFCVLGNSLINKGLIQPANGTARSP